LPRKLVWRPTEVESTIRASQAVIAPPSINASVGPLGGITLLPSLIGARNSPDGRRLAEILPGGLYARWLTLKEQYLGKNDTVERWRPIFAASELYEAALARSQLVPYAGVWPQVEKIARKAGVRVVEPEIEVRIEKARAAVKEFKRTSLDDVECFERTLRRLETDLDLMRERANAWAVGDVERLRRLAPVERATACIGVLLESSLVQERGYGDVIERARLAWLRAVEEALARNASTLAVTSVDELLRPDGHFARLRRSGYVVEEP
ncbi:MAG TPA: TraB/GumN family protein, partial [Steroidobacteraceae bacterium]